MCVHEAFVRALHTHGGQRKLLGVSSLLPWGLEIKLRRPGLCKCFQLLSPLSSPNLKKKKRKKERKKERERERKKERK